MNCKNFEVNAATFDMTITKLDFYLAKIYHNFQNDKANPEFSKEQLMKRYQKYDSMIDSILEFK